VGAKFAGNIELVFASGKRSWGARVFDMRSVFNLYNKVATMRFDDCPADGLQLVWENV